MYKKQRPKLSVTAVINSAQSPMNSNWFNGSTNGSMNGLPNQNQPSTRKFLKNIFLFKTNFNLFNLFKIANIDLISANGINYTPNLNTFNNQINTNGSINTSFDHHPSPTNSNSSSNNSKLYFIFKHIILVIL